MVDYGAMNRLYPIQKSRLTRALNIKDQEKRRDAVLRACRDAVHEWNEIGAWPDNWSRWQRALHDTFPVFCAPLLDEL